MEKHYAACIQQEIKKLNDAFEYVDVNFRGRMWVWLQQDMVEIQAIAAGIEAMLKEWADTTPKGEQT